MLALYELLVELLTRIKHWIHSFSLRQDWS